MNIYITFMYVSQNLKDMLHYTAVVILYGKLMASHQAPAPH